jgi:hypothetical protein
VNSLYEKLVSLWPALGSLQPWALYLIIALVLVSVVLLLKAVLSRPKKDDPYRIFKKDRLFKVDWTWEYRKKVPVNITFHCPTCHNELFYDEHRSGSDEGVEVSLECETCDRTISTIDGTYVSLLKRVQGHIERKIAGGSWKEEGDEHA